MSPRVLIVDDDQELLRGIQHRLHRVFDVQTASSAESAMVQLVANPGIAVLVSDFRMPVTDGITLLSRVREEMPNLVCILLTGHADVNTAAQAINTCGIFKLLLKPVPHGELELAIEAALAHHDLKEREQSLALEDFLLRIGNRRAFEQALQRTHMLATRHNRPYALAMLDVDHFKTYNDTYGHLAGDHVLESIATTIRGACRGSDEAFRYGGEEIVLLLPETPQPGLLSACERFRHKIECLQITHSNHLPPQITISIGASVYDCLEPIRSEDVLQRADLALYQSKADGRNRVTLWHPGHDRRQ